jgi:hypothetical protein
MSEEVWDTNDGTGRGGAEQLGNRVFDMIGSED